MPTAQDQDVREQYRRHAEATRDLGLLLREALPVRYTPSAHLRGSSDGPNNPTMDTALDPVRLALSDEIDRTATLLAQAVQAFRIQEDGLRLALARWSGDPDTKGIRELLAEGSLRH